MAELLALITDMKLVQFIAAAAFVFLVDWRLRTMIRKQVQDGVSGALEPMTKAIADNTDDITEIKGKLEEHYAAISKARDAADRAHERLDAIGAPRVRAVP
jgi:hypothetical protein